VQAECEVLCRIGRRNSEEELLLYHNVIFVKGLAPDLAAPIAMCQQAATPISSLLWQRHNPFIDACSKSRRQHHF
jgi:hypothetical protein